MPGDDRPSVYAEGDKIIYRASALGGCMKALALARAGFVGHSPPEQLQMVYDAGHEAEDVAIDWLSNKAIVEVFDRQRVVESKFGTVTVRGSIDGICLFPNSDLLKLLEIKSQSADVYDSWTPAKWTSDPLWMKYAWQVSAYMWSISRCPELVLLRVSREDEPRFHMSVIEKPFHSRGEIIARVMEVERMAEIEGLEAIDCQEDYGCPFYQYHKMKEAPVPTDDAQLQMATMEYLVAKRSADRFLRTAKDYKSVVEARMKELELTKGILPDGTKITVAEVPVKEHVVKARVDMRVTVTPPKEKK